MVRIIYETRYHRRSLARFNANPGLAHWKVL